MGEPALEITIAFGVDTAYVPHMAATIASIISNSKDCQFRFFVIHDGISDEDRKRVEAVAPGHQFEWPVITDSRMLNLGTRHHINRSTYYRFAIPELLPATTSKVLYLDSDLVVLRDIRELWNTGMQGHPIAAVQDPMVDYKGFAKRWDLPASERGYFNAGVLLFDLDYIRSQNVFEPAFDLMLNRWDDLDFGDQCILNILFWDNWMKLDPTWNVQRCMVLQEPNHTAYADASAFPTGRRPKIIHYTEHNKPWSVDAYHPYPWSYYKYLRHTPYWKEINRKAQTNFFKLLRRYIKTQLNFMALRSD